MTVVSYVERNPLRARLVERVQDWRWSSLPHDAHGPALDPGPVPRVPDWLEFVNTPMTKAEVAAIRLSLRRDRPYGTDSWTTETAGHFKDDPGLGPIILSLPTRLLNYSLAAVIIGFGVFPDRIVELAKIAVKSVL